MKTAKINVDTRYKLIKSYLEITKWASGLRPLEIKLLAHLIDMYLDLKYKIKDEELIEIVLGDYKTKMQIKQRMGDIHDSIFQNLLSSLRKKKALIGFKVNNNFIPDIKDNKFTLQYNFEING